MPGIMPQQGGGLLDPQMQQYLQQQRQQQFWSQIANAGMGILQASMRGADIWPALAQGLAQGGGGQQPMGLLDAIQFQNAADKRGDKRDRASRYAELVGGHDPKTGIDWNSGRIQGQAPATRLASSGAAPGGPTVGLLEQPSGGGLLEQPSGGGPLDPRTRTVPGQLGFSPEQQELLQAIGPEKGMGLLADRAFDAPKAPSVQTFYDQSTGREYKGQWNSSTRQWDKIGGLKTSGGDLTLGQQANNAEIDQARSTLDRMGLDKAEIMRRTQKATNTGRENADYDPGLERIVRAATQRKVGDDPYFNLFHRRYLGPPPEFTDPAGPKALPPGVSAEQPGILDRMGNYLFGGDDGRPRGRPRGGGRVRGHGSARANPQAASKLPAEPPRLANGGIDRNGLVVGRVYRHPVDGKTYRWNGQEFTSVR